MILTLKCLSPRPMATERLICFPHAGAGCSVYHAWADLLPDDIEIYGVQLPGREERLSAPLVTDWSRIGHSLPYRLML